MRAKDTNFQGQRVNGIIIKKLIGQGNWADVYLAQQIASRQPLAVKITPNKKFQQVPKLKELIRSQVAILKSCKNINVVKLIDQFMHKNHQFIVLEYCNGLQLGEILVRQTKIDEPTAISYLKQILNGFKGLHQVKAMHRDFKVQNVMLHDNVCKIVDLGFGKQLLNEGQMARTKLGSNFTMAPEVMQGLPYGFKADIWSIGVVFYQMLFGKFPFQGRNVMALLQKSKRQQYTLEQISQESKDFIKRCLKFDPQERINWADIYKHPLIVNQDLDVNVGPTQSKIDVDQNSKFYQLSNVLFKEAFPSLYKKEPSQEEKEQIPAQRSSILSLMKPKSQQSFSFQKKESVYVEQQKSIHQDKIEFENKQMKDESKSKPSIQDSIPQTFKMEEREERARICKRAKDIKLRYQNKLKDIRFMSMLLINQMLELHKNNPQAEHHHLIMACLLLQQSYLKLVQFIKSINFQIHIFQIQQNQFLYFMDLYGSMFLDRLVKNEKEIKQLFSVYKVLIQFTPNQASIQESLKNIQDNKNFCYIKYLDYYIGEIEKSYPRNSANRQKKILKLSFSLTKFKEFNLKGQFSSKALLGTLNKFNYAQAQNYLVKKYFPKCQILNIVHTNPSKSTPNSFFSGFK